MLVARSELNYYPKEELQYEEPKVRKRKKQRPKRRKDNSSVKLVYILMAIIFLGTALLILSRYAEITSVRTEITNLERERIELEKTKTNLIADLEGIKSSSQIAEDARIKLGMGYPDEGQIVYLSVQEYEENNVETRGIGEEIKKFFSMVTSLF